LNIKIRQEVSWESILNASMGYKMGKAMTDGNERVYKFLIDVYANKKRINESLRQKQEWQRKDIHIK